MVIFNRLVIHAMGLKKEGSFEMLLEYFSVSPPLEVGPCCSCLTLGADLLLGGGVSSPGEAPHGGSGGQ